jgi:hypothetical protein
VVVAALDTNFFVQFSGAAEPGSGTGDDNLFTTRYDQAGGTDADPDAFAAGDVFTQDMTTIVVSSSAAGVAGNTIQGGEVLDFNLYATDPGGTLGQEPTTSSTSMFIKLDGVGDSEDMIVVLKLYDTVLNTYTTRAVVVQNEDIITTNAELAGTDYAKITLDNNDGLIVIEANDYQQGNSNLVIVGAQIAGSDEGIIGTGINLNGDIDGASSGTQDFDTDVSDAPFKITSIGFVTSSTDDQNASLSFDVTIEDSDGDSVTQSVTVNIGDTTSNTTSMAPLSSKESSVQEPMIDKSSLLANDNVEQQSKSVNAANSNTVFLGAIAAAGLAGPAAAHDGFVHQAEFAIGRDTMMKPLDLGTPAMAADGQAAPALVEKSSVAVQDSDVPSSGSGRSAEAQGGNSVADSESGAHSAPAELPGGTDAPVQAPAAEVASGATSVAMPSAEMLAAAGEASLDGDKAATGEVARVLADALAGGGDGPNIDALLDAATAHGPAVSAEAGLEAIAAHLAAAVPAWDMGAFGGFTAGHPSFTMEAMMAHPDAVPQSAA